MVCICICMLVSVFQERATISHSLKFLSRLQNSIPISLESLIADSNFRVHVHSMFVLTSSWSFRTRSSLAYIEMVPVLLPMRATCLAVQEKEEETEGMESVRLPLPVGCKYLKGKSFLLSIGSLNTSAATSFTAISCVSFPSVQVFQSMPGIFRVDTTTTDTQTLWRPDNVSIPRLDHLWTFCITRISFHPLLP